jgi:hypothetical protein
LERRVAEKKPGIFLPGSRVVVFITNVDLLPDENANAFRAFAEDANGKQYRLAVESIRQVRLQNWIYGLTLRIYDENGYNGQPPSGELLIRVSWRGNTSNRVRLMSGQANMKIRDIAGLVPTPAPTEPPALVQRASTPADRKRFMEQAAFGPNKRP